MPALKNRRHEAFAQELVRGLSLNGRYPTSASAAYTRAGGTAHKPAAKVKACILLKAAPAIVERVKELQAETAKAAKTSLEAVIDRLDVASAMAERIEQPSGITAAEQAKAKLLGLEPPAKQEIGAPGAFDLGSAASSKDFARKYLQMHLGIAPESLSDNLLGQASSMIEQHYQALEALLPQTDQNKVTGGNQHFGVPH